MTLNKLLHKCDSTFNLTFDQNFHEKEWKSINIQYAIYAANL